MSRRFGAVDALVGVDLDVLPGEVHALLGPNGAGKTTLLRVLTGLVEPSEGQIALDGQPARLSTRAARSKIGLVPSGDRSFYLRISGLENLIFFGRLHGMPFRQARQRALAGLESVGLSDSARRPVGLYSHGMQKRLSVARGLLMNPRALFVDEATHDLDPEGARQVQTLVKQVADLGTAVIWTTQRIDEIRGFADRVTVLHHGRVRFVGTVAQLMATSPSRTLVLRVTSQSGPPDMARIRAALADRGTANSTTDADHVAVLLNENAILGEALAALEAAGISVIACREERSEIEGALLLLTGTDA